MDATLLVQEEPMHVMIPRKVVPLQEFVNNLEHGMDRLLYAEVMKMKAHEQNIWTHSYILKLFILYILHINIETNYIHLMYHKYQLHFTVNVSD